MAEPETIDKADTTRRRNSLDYVRLTLAVSVLVSHSAEIMDGDGRRELLTRLLGTLSFGEVAVDGFFILSGYLITLSWQREPQFFAFLIKRIRRIYPGFLAAAIVTGVIMAPFGTDASTYFQAFRLKTFLLGLPLLQQFVPESFQGQPFAIVNSALWTIPYEFLCYLMVACLGTLGLLKRKYALLFPAAAIALMTFHQAYALEWFTVSEDFRFAPQLLRFDQLCRFVAFYLAGVSYTFYGEGKRLSTRTVGILFLLLFAGMFSKVTANYVLMTCGSLLLFHFGLRTHAFLERFPLRADVSYGTYLYGWTIQQLVIQRLPASSPILVAFITIPLSLLAGMLSWKFIEKPFLHKKR